MNASIERTKETPKEILILFNGFSAFYRLPKDSKFIDEIKKDLTLWTKQKNTLTIKYDPLSTKIFSLNDQ